VFPHTRRPSPNAAFSTPHERSGVCFHHTVLSFSETVEWMLTPASEVSYHLVIDADGTRCTLVDDVGIAWHAGTSNFQGRSRCNDFLLGCAFAGDTYLTPLTEAQMKSALEWLDERWSRHGWSLARMIDHRQISPERKNDLNPIEWERWRERMVRRFGVT